MGPSSLLVATSFSPSPKQLDLRAIVETLRDGRATDAWMASWIPISAADPSAFSAQMFNLLAIRRGSLLKSEIGGGIDLYHDCVIALLGRRRTAISSQENGEWLTTSYEALHARCNALAAAWVERGVEAGQTVGILSFPGLDLAVSLLTSLRLGMIPTLIPPYGPTFVHSALTRCETDHIAASAIHRRLLPSEPLPVTAGARTAEPISSFSYPSDQPALRMLSPFGAEEDCLAEVSAQVLLEGAVRDALFVYNLDPGEVISAPGFDMTQYEPGLLLAALVAGATQSYIQEEDLEREPALIKQLGVRVLGLRRRLRDRWLREQRRLSMPVRSWFRSLTDTIDGDRWEQFSRTIPTPKQLAFTVVNGASGALLFSAPRMEDPGLRVWPTPGLPWSLGEVGAGEVQAYSEVGIFSVLWGDKPAIALPQVLIGRWGEGWAYGGALDTGSEAHRYPSDLIEVVATKIPAVRHASAFTLPGRWLNEAKVVLLIFVEARRPGERAPVEIAEVERQVQREMGSVFLPDRIEIVPLRPRVIEGRVDRAWCRSQYLTGMLHRKARSEVFVLLGRIGSIFEETTG